MPEVQHTINNKLPDLAMAYGHVKKCQNVLSIFLITKYGNNSCILYSIK